MVLQAQHGTCKEQFTKDQLRDFEQGWQSIFLPVPMLCTDIIAILLTMHTSFGYGVIFGFFSFRSILDESYGFDNLETSLAYLSLLVAPECVGSVAAREYLQHAGKSPAEFSRGWHPGLFWRSVVGQTY
ncbi:hypothetical protein BJX66DRAFT_320941 [Aspergillus keveii]|uniref:Uncharacterized protein n=1 Tax=Aspergillus keveii TaxID=714993 RepID=A0ABR4FGW4_9EURO